MCDILTPAATGVAPAGNLLLSPLYRSRHGINIIPSQCLSIRLFLEGWGVFLHQLPGLFFYGASANRSTDHWLPWKAGYRCPQEEAPSITRGDHL